MKEEKVSKESKYLSKFVYSKIDYRIECQPLLLYLMNEQKVVCPLFLARYIDSFVGIGIGGENINNTAFYQHLQYWIDHQKRFVNAYTIQTAFCCNSIIRSGKIQIFEQLLDYFFINTEAITNEQKQSKEYYNVLYHHVIFMERFCSTNVHLCSVITSYMERILQKLKIVDLKTLDFIIQVKRRNGNHIILPTYTELQLTQYLFQSCRERYYEPFKQIVTCFIPLDIYLNCLVPFLNLICTYERN
jgi:hypothetical protein